MEKDGYKPVVIRIETPLKGKKIIEARLAASSSMPTLASFASYRNMSGVYPSSTFKLNSTQMDKWLTRQLPAEVECDESAHDILIDEEQEVQAESPKHSPPAQKSGAESIIEFYDKYKGMNKSTSPFRFGAKSPAYQYLSEIDKMHQLPKPMGMAKWKGPANELNLQ